VITNQNFIKENKMGKPTAEDYTELRMVAERYVDAVNRFDPEAWGETWAPDGEWTTSEVRKGRENMVEVWTNIMESIDMVFMKVYSGVIDDVSGDTANGRWYLGEFLHRAGGTSENCICYEDTYRRIDGQWYIQTRKFVAVYRGETGLTAEGFKSEFRGLGVPA
jgi:hypothetical protein